MTNMMEMDMSRAKQHESQTTLIYKLTTYIKPILHLISKIQVSRQELVKNIIVSRQNIAELPKTSCFFSVIEPNVFFKVVSVRMFENIS